MFAVIKTGGKQYVVRPGQKLKVEKLNIPEGSDVTFEEVLLRADDTNVEVGQPFVKDAKVKAKVTQQGRAKKVIVFRYHSKTRYRKKKGHRQPFSEVEITGV